MSKPTISRLALLLVCATLGTLSACGSNDLYPELVPQPRSCSTHDRQDWLRAQMRSWYFWADRSPDVAPDGFAGVEDYFAALLYTGSDGAFPADRWSYISRSEDFELFYGAGQTLGFGVMVAGLEILDTPEQPLWVRYVEPGSPADTAGLRRGDQLLSLNGVAVSTLVAANDFSALSATAAGQSLNLTLRREGVEYSLSLTAAVYDLAPVPQAQVLNSPSGRKVGYLLVKDMIDPVRDGASAAFSQFRSAGVQDLVIDLRYNGGGLVSVAAQLASYVAAQHTAGQVYTQLRYNSQHPEANTTFRFSDPSQALQLERVYVLTGPRTCSASEQLINALQAFVPVTTVGDTSCGKPVGFLPDDDGCGAVFSAVKFDSVNALGAGGYYNGLNANCPEAENFAQPLGSSGEPLLARALALADGQSCPATAAAAGRARPLSAAHRALQQGRVEPGERQGMWGR